MARIVDLSLDIYDKAPTFWPDPKTAVLEHLKLENLQYNITQLIMSTHLGTHLDAPFHFFDDGRTCENLDLTKCFGPAWVLDFTDKGVPKGKIEPDDLKPHEDKITKGARLIIRMDWDKKLPDNIYFAEGPCLTPDACQYLADRDIATIAMDVASICSEHYVEAHHALLKKEILIVEGLANLDQLKADRVLFSALPLRIKGRDGSPCRAIAIEGLPDELLQAMEL
jgi:kynurenine formamidase